MWLARSAAQPEATQETILVDASGNWLETSTGNLWGWKDNCWWTPPLTAGILPGIVRSHLIKKLNVREEPWNQVVFEAIAYTNSVVEVIPIHTVIQPPNLNNIAQLTFDPYHPSLNQLKEMFDT